LKKQVLVSVDRGETRVALLEATGTVAQSKPGAQGSRRRRKTTNPTAGYQVAELKNGFLHVDEIVLPGVEAPRRGRGGARDGRQITDMLKPGQEIVVQVVKDPLKTNR